MTTLMPLTASSPGLCLLTEKSRKMLRKNSRQSQVLAQDRPRGTIFCQRDRNLLLSFYNPLYSNPRKAEKQLLIKQSMKLYVVIKCHQSTEHHMQINRVEGLSSFHMLWSFLLFFPSRPVENKYVTLFSFIFKLWVFTHGKDVQFLPYLQIFPTAPLQNLIGKRHVSDTQPNK